MSWFSSMMNGVVADGYRGCDPFFSNVTMLLHFDGNATDSSLVNATLTPTNLTYTAVNALVDKSASYSSSTLTSPTTANYDLNSGDFTIELWIRPNFSGGTSIFRINGPLTSQEYSITYEAFGGSVYNFFYPSSAGALSNISTPSYTANTWTHLAFTRQGNIYRPFVNGVQKGSATNSYRRATESKTALIGSTNSTGLFDEVRITKGVARYTADFPLPAVPFPSC